MTHYVDFLAAERGDARWQMVFLVAIGRFYSNDPGSGIAV